MGKKAKDKEKEKPKENLYTTLNMPMYAPESILRKTKRRYLFMLHTDHYKKYELKTDETSEKYKLSDKERTILSLLRSHVEKICEFLSDPVKKRAYDTLLATDSLPSHGSVDLNWIELEKKISQ